MVCFDVSFTQVIVVLVGTNNHGHNADQITEGIIEIVKTINEKQPQAQIIVMVGKPYNPKPRLLSR